MSTVTNSILNTIKMDLGAPVDDPYYDQQIILHINAAFSVLTQLAVGPKEGFSISDMTAIWDDFIDSSETKKFEAVKEYIYLKVKLVFDPPENSFTINLFKERVDELEFRLNSNAEYDPDI